MLQKQFCHKCKNGEFFMLSVWCVITSAEADLVGGKGGRAGDPCHPFLAPTYENFWGWGWVGWQGTRVTLFLAPTYENFLVRHCSEH